jgi:hypothetical protein
MHEGLRSLAARLVKGIEADSGQVEAAAYVGVGGDGQPDHKPRDGNGQRGSDQEA